MSMLFGCFRIIETYYIILAYFYKKVNRNLLPRKNFDCKIVAMFGKI